MLKSPGAFHSQETSITDDPTHLGCLVSYSPLQSPPVPFFVPLPKGALFKNIQVQHHPFDLPFYHT